MNHHGIGIFYADKRSDGPIQGRWRLFNVRPDAIEHFIVATRQDGVEVRVHEHDLRVSTVHDYTNPVLTPVPTPVTITEPPNDSKPLDFSVANAAAAAFDSGGATSSIPPEPQSLSEVRKQNSDRRAALSSSGDVRPKTTKHRNVQRKNARRNKKRAPLPLANRRKRRTPR